MIGQSQSLESDEHLIVYTWQGMTEMLKISLMFGINSILEMRRMHSPPYATEREMVKSSFILLYVLIFTFNCIELLWKV